MAQFSLQSAKPLRKSLRFLWRDAWKIGAGCVMNTPPLALENSKTSKHKTTTHIQDIPFSPYVYHLYAFHLTTKTRRAKGVLYRKGGTTRLHGSWTLLTYISQRSWRILWQRRYTTKSNSRRITPDYPPHSLTNSGPTIRTTLVPIRSPAVVPA